MSWVQEFFLSFLSVIKIFLWSKPLRSNKKEQQKNQNQKLIILANGPSFGQSIEKYSSIIRKTPLLTVNLFSCSDYFEELKPQHYMLLAPQFFKKEEHLVLQNII